MISRDRFLQSIELLGIAVLELGLKLAPCGQLLPSLGGLSVLRTNPMIASLPVSPLGPPPPRVHWGGDEMEDCIPQSSLS